MAGWSAWSFKKRPRPASASASPPRSATPRFQSRKPAARSGIGSICDLRRREVDRSLPIGHGNAIDQDQGGTMAVAASAPGFELQHNIWFLAAKSRPLIVGHRGVPVLHQENTLAGFRRAVELGLDAIEL